MDVHVMERVKELEQRSHLANLESREASINTEEIVERLTFIDPLTNLYNSRTFTKEMTFETRRAKRYKRPIALCLVIIDNLAEISRKYGAITYDVTLKSVSGVIQQAVREVDIAARYTSDHYSVLMPETNSVGAMVVAERIRQRIKKHVVSHGKLRLNVTASIGLTGYPAQTQDIEELMTRAGVALEQAIASGGDKVCLL
jgi:diguanylate cyclase (GGDEF)-like protein